MLHEIPVDVFERASGRFGVEKVDEGHKSAIEHGPDDVKLPTKRPNTNGRDLYNNEITEPVCSRSERSALKVISMILVDLYSLLIRTFVFHREGVDFSRI